uniref:F-box domain-containing protein n=1 Tax=viral metagenome TaxID=1070528 RepID=A0A6C0HL60_9ZZZZ
MANRQLQLPVLPKELWELVFGFLDETSKAVAMHVCHEWRALVLVTTRKVIPRIFAKDVRSSYSLIEWWRNVLGQPLPLDYYTCISAVNHGHLAFLQYARAHARDDGCPWDEYICLVAAESGHLAILQYLHDNGCPWDKRTCSSAAAAGHLAILQYAHDNGCPWDTLACQFAADQGHLAILQYLRTNGCPWDEWTYYTARSKNLAILQYAIDNGCKNIYIFS